MVAENTQYAHNTKQPILAEITPKEREENSHSGEKGTVAINRKG